MSAQARILVVDDTPNNVKLLSDLLGLKGYAVSTAANGEEGLAKIASEKPDLVLLDVMMPGLSGYDVCKRIRDDPTTALLPVVLVTSLDPAQERVRGLEAGADDFLPKPINQLELFARVRSLLRVKSLQDDVGRHAEALKVANLKLEQRVDEQVAQLDRLSQLKRFFSCRGRRDRLRRREVRYSRRTGARSAMSSSTCAGSRLSPTRPSPRKSRQCCANTTMCWARSSPSMTALSTASPGTAS